MRRTCVKCQKRPRKLTKHHILPRRFYGSPPDAPILLICRMCHDKLEELIPQFTKKPDEFYWRIIFVFLESRTITVHEWGNPRSYVAIATNHLEPLDEFDFRLVPTTQIA